MPAPGHPSAAPAIRDAKAGDAAALAVLSTELGYPSTPAQIGTRLKALQADEALFVAESNGQVAGFVHVQVLRVLVEDAFGEIGALAVAPWARRRGVGRALLDAAAGWTHARGLTRLRVRANSARSGAHRFYPAAGFRLLKEQHVYEREV